MTFVTGFWSHGARGPARPWGECTVARIPWAVASLLRLHRPALPRTAQRSREAAPPGLRAMKAGTETGGCAGAGSGLVQPHAWQGQTEAPLGKTELLHQASHNEGLRHQGLWEPDLGQKGGAAPELLPTTAPGAPSEGEVQHWERGLRGPPWGPAPSPCRGASTAPERGSCDQEKQRAPRGAASDGSGGSEETCEALHVSIRAENHTFTYDGR